MAPPLACSLTVSNLSHLSFNIFLAFCCSLAQLCLTLCYPMDCRRLGFPVLLYLLEFAQTHVHWVSDAIESHTEGFWMFCSFFFFNSENSLKSHSILYFRWIGAGFVSFLCMFYLQFRQWASFCCYCSVTKSYPTLYNPMDCSIPASSMYVPEFAQIHVHWVSDAT